jgi:uncharacterized protein YdeI (BOF family)
MKKEQKVMDKKNYILIVACIVCLAAVSCRSLMDRVTPTENSQQAYEYVHESLDGYKEIDSLYNVKKLRMEVIIKHRKSLLEIKRSAEDEGYAFDDALGTINSDIEEAENLQDLVVGGEDQEFSLLGILAGFTGGAAIGRALKRKGDYSPAEVEEIVARAKKRTV